RLLYDLLAQQARALRQLVLARLEQEAVEPAAMLDRAQSGGRDAQAEAAAERLGHQGDIHEIRQKAAPRLVVGVAHIVAAHHGLAGQFTRAGHLDQPSQSFRGTPRQYRSWRCAGNSGARRIGTTSRESRVSL